MWITSVSILITINIWEFRKLDLTLNFIDIEDLEESMENLAECESIQELYLTGNPCASWPDFKDYVIAKVI